MSMTLEQVRDWHRKQAYACGISQSRQEEGMHHDMMADAIDAHLTQTAQSVTGEMVERVCIAHYDSWSALLQWERGLFRRNMKRVLTTALQEKGNA